LGVSPAEDEWWKVYMNIEYPTAATGEGNWPLAFAGTPQGANVMNPLNAFIFGRTTAENKLLKKMGPWAEGNNFDGSVDSSRAVLSNKQYWESAFSQRGAMALNKNYTSSFGRSSWKGYSYFGRLIPAEYLPSPYDPIYLSSSLFAAGRSSDKFFKEYASNTIYMRYPPSIQRGYYVKYGVPKPAGAGVLKRKNAAKDLISWGLWAYAYYFKGSEQQRSIFCEKRPWKSKVIDFTATKEYTGQQRPFVEKRDVNGPLTVCDVGFDFYKYYTRQNVFAPALGLKHNPGVPGGVEEEYSEFGAYKKLDGIGNPKLDQYRVSYKYEIPPPSANNWDIKQNLEFNSRSWCYRDNRFDYVTEGMENYDHLQFKKRSDAAGKYGKTLRVKKAKLSNTTASKRFLMSCYYDNAGINKTDGTDDTFTYKSLTGVGAKTEEYDYNTRKAVNSFPACLAGYYLQTTAVENPGMKFKLRIWAGSKIMHETIINKKYSYAVNRNFDAKHNSGGKQESRAYIFNKMHYFKKGITDKYGAIRFEIVPVVKDDNPPYSGEPKEQHKGDGLICFGNPFSSTVSLTLTAGTNMPYRKWEIGIDRAGEGDTMSVGAQYLKVDGTAGIKTGDLVRIKYQYRNKVTGLVNVGHKSEYSTGAEYKSGYINGGQVLFARRGLSPNDDKLYFYERQDGYQLSAVAPDGSLPGREAGNVLVYTLLSQFTVNGEEEMLGSNDIAELSPALPHGPNTGQVASLDYRCFPTRQITLEKMEVPFETFKVTLDLAVLVQTKPTFQDAYALLRAATDKQNRRNTESNIIFGDAKGVGTVGHHFTESNRVFNNYYKYGSAMNIYGSGVVPALRMYVSANPIYESMRKFISSFMRFAGRRELINYAVERGKGVFYFKRFAWGLPRKAKATILRNMEPSIDPCGWFSGSNDRAGSLAVGHAKFTPIKPMRFYRVTCPSRGYIVYDGKKWRDGQPFLGLPGKEHIESYSNLDPSRHGAFEKDGINDESFSNGISAETNEWIMFMTSSHYHWANSNIYKPSVYNDIMGFLNNRCHHRSKEYERGIGDQYDMIRTELCRVMPGPRNDPGPRLHIFMSKSSSNLTYIFNTNDPYQGNLHLYAEHSSPPYDYYRSCPPMTRRPYRVKSVRVVNSRGLAGHNPSGYSIDNRAPNEVVRVELDRPLRGTGRLYVGRSGWRSVNPAKLKKEPYRTDENAVIEYLHHQNATYSCKRNMIGDHGAESDVVTGSGYRPFGACYPRFYFLKLIPKVSKGSLLSTEPYAQMDFYFRAMSGAFLNPYSTPIKYGLYKQTSVLNWQFGELASRSSEEDPTLYEYVDPRSIQS
jgi:hypothetical protein